MFNVKKIVEKIKIMDIDIITTFILSFIFFCIVLTSILFLIGVSITNLHFISSILLGLITTYIIFKNKCENFNFKKLIINCILCVFIIFFCIMIANVFYDNTWDGNTYHKEMIGLMKNGMNPVFNNQSGDIWVQHYARAVETFSAVIYSFTDNIESGKSINYLLILVLFMQIVKYLNEKKVNMILSIAIGFVVALNPISLIQSTTYYVDGVFANVLFFIILILLKITENKEIKLNNILFTWLAMLVVICVNIKFTSLLICTMFIGVFCLYWLYTSIHKKEFLLTLKKLFLFFIVLYIFAVLIVGQSVYVKNFLQYGHPFYPLKGEATDVDIVTGNEPTGLEEYSHVEKFIYTLFSKTYTWYDKKPELKLPFTVYNSELESMKYVDTRIGAFGPLYSGILLISLPIIIFYIIKNLIKKNNKIILLLLILIAIILPIPILPVVWQLRYYPQLYLLPIIALFLLILDSKNIFKKIYISLISLTLIVNISLFVPTIINDLKASVNINRQLIYLFEQSLYKDVIISIEDCPNAGARYNLLDKKINYTFLMEKIEDGEPMYYRFFYKFKERKMQ